MMASMTDQELVIAAKSGDKEAFGQLAEKYQQMAMNIALRMGTDEGTAQDLAQETMLQAYLSLDSLREANRFQSWLYGIALNVCRSYWRERQMKPISLEASADRLRTDSQHASFHEASPEQVVQQRELHAHIRDRIDSLSSKNRTVTLLFYDAQLSIREIAELLGVSTTAVKNRLYKSRKQMREQLAPLYTPASLASVTVERNKNMIEITDVHVVRTAETENHIVLLLDRPGRRVLPIWVDPSEGIQILLHLREYPGTTPRLFNFVTTLLTTLDAKLEEVRIEMLKDGMFYAVAKIRAGGKEHELAAKPGYAVALALHAESPLFVADDVMHSAAIDLPDTFDENAWRRQESYRLVEIEQLYGLVIKSQDEMEWFTKKASQALARAQEEARRLHHNVIGTEHLLLSLVLIEDCMAARVLHELGVERARVLNAVEQMAGPKEQAPVDEPVLAARTEQVIALAAEERRVLGHRYIGTEHLLIGLVREDKSAAASILRSLDVNLGQMRTQYIDLMTRTTRGVR